MLYQILATIGIAAALLMIGFVICVLSDSMPPTSCCTGIKKIRQLEREKKAMRKPEFWAGMMIAFLLGCMFAATWIVS